MLFTDGHISTIEELSTQDSAVLDIASTEAINVTAKLGLAQEELAIELRAALARSRLSGSDSMYWWPGNPVTNSSQYQLRDVVVTPALRLWHTFYTLALIYRDAYNSQLNDRYLGKWRQYRDLAGWASDRLFQAGIGTATDPVPIAEVPELTAQPGNFSALTYYVQVSWLNARGEEGMSSPVASLDTPDQTALQVRPMNPPIQAKAWNIYAGDTVTTITRQNASPLDLSEVWVEPSFGLLSGTVPGTGQEPNYFRSVPHILQRG